MARIDQFHYLEADMTLGQRLAAARKSRGIELERAAHETRIRAQRLRELEADDYSHCPHPSYARMFLRDYAKYLGVPLAEIREALPEFGSCGAEGYQYLEELSGESLAAPAVQRLKPRRRILPLVAALAAALVLAAGGLWVTLTIRKLEHLNLGKPSESVEVKPAAPVPAEPAVAEPDPVPSPLVAEDLALLNRSISERASESFAPLPTTLALPAASERPDDRAALVGGGGLDQPGQVQ